MQNLKIHSVSFAEFDIDVGNTLTFKYPDFTLKEYDIEYLGNCCLPDGGHIHQEDWNYLILLIKDPSAFGDDQKSSKNQKKKTKTNEETNDKSSTDKQLQNADKPKEEVRILYGLAYFRNMPDATVKRGAIQKSILLLTWQPYFQAFQPLLKATLHQYIGNEKTVKDPTALLRTLFDAIDNMIKANSLKLTLFGENYPINIPLLEEDQFEGQPAQAVGNCALAAPLLAAPIKGFTPIITPYVALTDISPILRPTYICGTTNSIFETKTDWYDAMGSFSTGAVINNCGIKVGGTSREFMKNVMSGIQDNRGEQWVRKQFYQYTNDFLLSIKEEKMKKEHRKYLSAFKDSEMYRRYEANFAKESPRKPEQTAIESFREIESSINNPDPSIGTIQQTKMLYQLMNKLEDLTAVEEVCDADGVSVIATLLGDTNSQMRKYAVSVVARLAISVKGQIAIMSDQVLAKVINMLHDPMPNVVTAACYCLLKLSTLFIGVQALVTRNVMNDLTELISSPESNLDIKTTAVSTLLQIYTFAPLTPRTDGLKSHLISQLKSPDRKYKFTILQLLDLWCEDIPEVPISDITKHHIQRLQAKKREEDRDEVEDADSRAAASTYLLSDLNKTPELTLELIQAGGVEILLKNASIASCPRLCRFSYSLLGLVADSYFGRRKINQYRVIQLSLDRLNDSDSLNLFHIVRFLEVCSQHSDTRKTMFEAGALDSMLAFILRHEQTITSLLCVPALGVLRFFALFDPSARSVMNDEKYRSVFNGIVTKTTQKRSDDSQASNTQLNQLSQSILKLLARDTTLTQTSASNSNSSTNSNTPVEQAPTATAQ